MADAQMIVHAAKPGLVYARGGRVCVVVSPAQLRLCWRWRSTAPRVSELCGLRWRDARPRDDAGQVTLFGKGGKTRTVLLTAATWRELEAARGDAGSDDPVFRSQKGGPLSPVQVWRIVRAAARRAGIEGDVSPHWLRHAHASHALDRGAPVHLVQATLGHADLRTTSKYTHARPTDSSARYLGI